MQKCIFFLFLWMNTMLLLAQKKDDEVKETYMLVWNDEFNYKGMPDTSKWDFEIGYQRNNEAQWYQKDNAICKGGFLKLVGKKEEKPNPNYIAGSSNWKTEWPKIKYTSASIKMKKEQAFQYGKVEVRAKIDAQTGLWPAIWTLGLNGEWPSNGEVDIMEYYDSSILANFAYASKKRYNAIWDSKKTSIDSLQKTNWANHFHIWTLVWTENSMQIFVDDLLLNEINIKNVANKTDGKNPFRQPHILLLNLALGGMNGGSLLKTNLPSEFIIDYVRIYQKK